MTMKQTKSHHGSNINRGEESLSSFPYDKANIISKWTFHWISPLMKSVRRKKQDRTNQLDPESSTVPTPFIQLDSLPSSPTWLQSRHILVDFLQARQSSKSTLNSTTTKKARSWICVIVMVGGVWWVVWSGILALAADILQSASADVMRHFVESLSRPKPLDDMMGGINSSPIAGAFTFRVYWLAMALFACSLGRKLVLNQSLFIISTVAYMIRSATMASLYEHIVNRFTGSWDRTMLTRPRTTEPPRAKSSLGSTFNRLAVDANRIATMILFGHLLWSCPLRILLVFRTIWSMMGTPAIWAMAIILLVMGILFLVAHRLRILRKELAQLADERLQLTGDAIRHLDTIKSLNLTRNYYQRIDQVRQAELKGIWRLNRLFALSASLNFWSPVLATTVMVSVAVIGSDTNEATKGLAAGTVFAAARALQSLMVPLWLLPTIINRLVAASVSAQRIDYVLSCESQDDGKKRNLEPIAEINSGEEQLVLVNPIHNQEIGTISAVGEALIDLQNIQVKSCIDERILLHNISLQIIKPGLYVITGPPGSGKSTLLTLLAGIIKDYDGKILNLPQSVGYCPVPGWLRRGTVADNIVFDRPLDVEELNRVMKAVCLRGELFEDTFVGEAGCTLSGGQRQRVALARALYGHPTLLLVDNIFSSLDGPMAQTIWQNCFANDEHFMVARGTQQVNNPTTDIPTTNNQTTMIKIIVTNDPKWWSQCEGRIIRMKNSTIEQFDQHHHNDNEIVTNLPPVSESNRSLLVSTKSELGSEIINANVTRTRPYGDDIDDQTKRQSSGNLIKRAVREAGGWWTVIMLFLVFLGTDLAKLERDKCLKNWIDKPLPNNDTLDEKRRFSYKFIGWGSAHGILTASSNVLAAWLCLRAARRIHSMAMRRILDARITSLQASGTGRVLNRLGKDLEALDYHLPEKLISLMGCTSTVLCTILAIAQKVPSVLVTLLVPILWVAWLQRRFTNLWRGLLRASSQAMAPLSMALSESLAGLPTIRAHGIGQALIDKFHQWLDRYTMSSVLSLTARRWISLRAELGSTLYLAGVLAYCLGRGVSSADAALLLMYVLGGVEAIDWFIKHFVEMEQYLVAIERITGFAEALPIEGILPSEGTKMRNFDNIDNYSKEEEEEEEDRRVGEAGAMTNAAEIKFENVNILYEGVAITLQPINLTIVSKEKLVIIGRTGVGKSSLLSAIIRMVDYQGRITLDGSDINSLSLFHLRRRIASIRQETSLLGKSVREALDPKSRYDNVCLEEILCKLKWSGPGLEAPSDILTAGQRQLLVMGRILLRRPTILLLDEATSALERDEEGQFHRWLVQEELKDATVVTVTHRVELVDWYERVIVLERGGIVEMGRRKDLLSDVNSRLYQLRFQQPTALGCDYNS